MRKSRTQKSRAAERRKSNDLPALFVGLKDIFEQIERRKAKHEGATK